MKKKNTLLNKAKDIPVRKRAVKIYTPEEIELVEAWIDDKVGLSQLSKALDFGSSNQAYGFIALVCKQMMRK